MNMESSTSTFTSPYVVFRPNSVTFSGSAHSWDFSRSAIAIRRAQMSRCRRYWDLGAQRDKVPLPSDCLEHTKAEVCSSRQDLRQEKQEPKRSDSIHIPSLPSSKLGQLVEE